MIIDNYEYDITNYNHPGGSVINYLNGQDATNAFQEFHYRSKKALMILKSLPRKKRVVEDKELEDFQNFRRSLEERGFFNPSSIHIMYRITELVFLYGLSILATTYNIWLSVLLFGFFGAKCGWLQHEAGHNSFTGDIKTDKRIQNAAIGFGLCIDGSMWNSMHNTHHAATQKIGHDVDLNTAPLVVFHNSKEKFSRPIQLWLRYQKYTFIPITSGILVMMYWVFYLHPRKIIQDKNISQATIVIAGHALRIFFMKGVVYHIISLWITGMYMFGHFSLSHTFTPTVSIDENPNWVRYAIEHTVDIEPDNKWVGWLMGYLNNQVIHHLFPSMPQYRGPEVVKELNIFCKKWDIKYRQVGYFEAWNLMFQNLEDVGKNVKLSK